MDADAGKGRRTGATENSVTGSPTTGACPLLIAGGRRERGGERGLRLLQEAQAAGHLEQRHVSEPGSDAPCVLPPGGPWQSDEQRAGKAGSAARSGQPAADRDVGCADVAGLQPVR